MVGGRGMGWRRVQFRATPAARMYQYFRVAGRSLYGTLESTFVSLNTSKHFAIV